MFTHMDVHPYGRSLIQTFTHIDVHPYGRLPIQILTPMGVHSYGHSPMWNVHKYRCSPIWDVHPYRTFTNMGGSPIRDVLIWEDIYRQNSNPCHKFVFYGVWFWPTGIIQNAMVVSMWCLYESHCITFTYLVPDDSWYSGLALSFGIRSKALTVEE